MLPCLLATAAAVALAYTAPLSAGVTHRASSRLPRAPSCCAPEEGSLIPDTLAEMNADPEVGVKLTARERMEERKLRRRALDQLGVPAFGDFVEAQTGETLLRKRSITLLQLNVGLFCNQACTHCHVESSPKRTEAMSDELAEHILKVLAASPTVRTVDITGGAPEMNPAFRRLVEGARALGLEVIDRCNLTVLSEPNMEWLPQFLADQGVRVVASLPCYSEANVDKQRGNKVFERSIRGLQTLNAFGFGKPGSGLYLDLVYNPGGAFLPPSQSALREAYARELDANFGLVFNELFTMTNMPVKRFADMLARDGKLVEYMQLLVDNFNPQTVESIMCRELLSVGYDGQMYDCDFNYSLEAPHGLGNNILSLDSLNALEGQPITTGTHCFGCTAGAGSS